MSTLPPLETIPEHLREYITEQNPELYTYIDHAAWRYIMRVSKAFFSKHAHPLYLQGLDGTGISTESIPLIQDMDEALRKLGWRAVAINGFIPPAIFLEFQSLRILAIACDMRKLENLGYTPSPDIVHEAAGHAPIVADPLYRSYLEAYGEVARNAIISKHDLDLYEAIYNLSEIKENPESDEASVELAQKKFEEVAARESEASEASLLARMAWWTTEYGLVGSLDKPLIYGAGLLSSVEESFNCLKPEVKKVPFTLEAALKTSYDITQPQPQLFVAKNFEELTKVLDDFANTMAFRRGGIYGLEIGKKAQNTVTVALDNGIQLTGTISAFESGIAANGTPQEMSFTLTGPKQVSYMNEANEALNTHHLPASMLIPLFDKAVAVAGLEDIQRKLHGSGLHTKNGMRIQGHFKKEVTMGANARILILEQVRITDAGGKLIYEERQKTYPLTLANKVNSVFGGAADRKEFTLRNVARSQKVQSHKTNLTHANEELNNLYRQVREFREIGLTDLNEIQTVLTELNEKHESDWLLRLELLELYEKNKPDSVITAQLRTQLIALKEANPSLKDMIGRGMELI